MSLQSWRDNGWLEAQPADPERIAGLLAVADRDLADCAATGLSADARFSIAYNAALQSATAALAACGYRASRESHHYRVIQSLTLTLRVDPALIERLDRGRRKRNIADYDRPGVASEQETQDMYALASELRQDVEAWLRAEHPELIVG